MRICKIWDADYPWDVRVEKVATSLAAAGHSVHLVCRNDGRRPTRELCGNFAIHRLPPLPRVVGPVHKFWNFPYPANPAWIAAIDQTVRAIDADLILVRDLPLAIPAVAIGRMRGVPVILDMAENYAAMLEDKWRYTPMTAMDRAVHHPAAARLVERVAVRLSEHIIVVVEESRERLIRAGVDACRISVVSNTPRPEQWDIHTSAQRSRGRSTDTHLIYVGNLDGSRGIDTVVRALRYLNDGGHPTRLTVIGEGPCLERWRDLALRMGLAEQVEMTGRLPFSEVQRRMAEADVGVIPHYVTEAWNSTVPNKLFDYMLFGLPVIVSDARPAARIVADERCGEVFRDRDVEDLARSVTALADPATRRQRGLAGRRAIERRYHWNYDAQVLTATIERVGQTRSARPLRTPHAALTPE
jgi:glycosyltransferase involved in cell wall biosynthesis